MEKKHDLSKGLRYSNSACHGIDNLGIARLVVSMTPYLILRLKILPGPSGRAKARALPVTGNFGTKTKTVVGVITQRG